MGKVCNKVCQYRIVQNVNTWVVFCPFCHGPNLDFRAAMHYERDARACGEARQERTALRTRSWGTEFIPEWGIWARVAIPVFALSKETPTLRRGRAFRFSYSTHDDGAAQCQLPVNNARGSRTRSRHVSCAGGRRLWSMRVRPWQPDLAFRANANGLPLLE